MGLTGWLLRRTPPRPLLVTAPGGTAVRVAVERLARERGWRPATAPADANLLVVAGVGLDVTRVWQAIPAPRVRVDLVPGADVAGELAAAVAALHDVSRQRREAAQPPSVDPTVHTAHMPEADHAPGGGSSGQEAHDEHGSHGEHGGHAEHPGHAAHGGHAGHDMSGMELPGGIAMAERAEDRDGLMLDQLTFPLGPALPLWPAGLTVHTRLQGDVIQSATVELLPPGEPFWRHHPQARRLDACARLLALAGWEDAARTADTLRDRALAGEPASIDRWARRVRRSRTLRWLLTGVGAAPVAPEPCQGDALDRLHRWLDTGLLPDRRDTQWAVEHLPALLTGTELATARLTVASLALDLDLLGGTP